MSRTSRPSTPVRHALGRRRITVAAAAAIGLTTGASAPLTGQASAPVAAPAAAPATDSSIVRFLSVEIPRQLKVLDVPGAIVTVVQGGRVIMNAAFGKASVDPPVAAHADSTTVRIASVTKVFTALAVLRVAESGRIGLHADLHPFLADIPIRGRVTGPLTLHQLLTHTAGFDDRNVGYLNPPGAEPEPLAAHLARAMPARMRVATDVPAYSNHGYGLAGLVVERATGMPFTAYVRDSILLPLGMADTRFVLQPGDTVGMRLASEYRSSGARRVQRSSRPYPAGNLATTGRDMSRFLVALGRARHGDSVPVISPAIAQQLSGPVLTYHPQLPPMGYGLSGVPMHGQTVWVKGGASPSHSAVVAVLPELDLGVFLAVNRQEPLVWDRVLPAFVIHLLGRDHHEAAVPSPNDPSAVSGLLEGTYLWTRAPVGSAEKVLGLATQVSVSSTPGGVRVDGLGEIAGTYARRGSTVFERADGRRIAFRRVPNGRASHLFTIVQGQPFSLERIPISGSTRVQVWGLVVATVLSITAAVATARSKPRGAAGPRWARAMTIALPVALGLTVAAAVALARQADRLQQESTPLLRLTLILATITAIVVVAQIASTAVLAVRSPGSRLSRAVYVAGAVGGAMLLWFLASNNLVGRWTG